MVVLDNGKLRIEINELGAEIRRATLNGEERMWNGDPAFWTGVAPVLFPICGTLKDDKFTHKGKEYELASHGFARKSLFEVEEKGETYAVFLLRDNEETLKKYPWHFELRVKYVVTGNAIKISYDIKNNSEDTMYYAIGSHEAYLCPEGIEDYDVIFEKKETLDTFIAEDSKLLGKKWLRVLKDSDTLPLYIKDFEKYDSYVFTDLKSRFATLRNRKTGKSVSVAFEGFDNFLVWSAPGAPYLCLEPWTGCPSFDYAGYEISEKEGMSALESGETAQKIHTVYFE